MSVRRTTFMCALAAGVAVGATLAQTAAAAIYSCTGKDGKPIVQDHPIVDCPKEDQVEQNSDGSRKRIVPRPETEEERAAREARERAEEAERVQRQVNIRADRLLLLRFPNKAAHDVARTKALDVARGAIRSSEERKKLLLTERKPLLDEAEFYVGKPLPINLKLALDSNDAALAAQESARQNQEAELARITKKFDEELERLRMLWAAPPRPQKQAQR
jgi:hypothetical protein